MKIPTRSIWGVVASAAALLTPLALPTTAGAAPPPSGTILTITWGGEAGPPQLLSLDPTTGAATLIGDTGVESSTAIQWDESTGKLFATQWDWVPTSLFEVDPSSGASTNIATTSVNDFTGMASQPTTGTLFVAYDDLDSDGSVLATLDMTTGQATDIDTVTVDGVETRVSSLAIRRSDGALFGFTYGEGGATFQLLRIDLTTADATVVGDVAEIVWGADFDCNDKLLGVIELPESEEQILAEFDPTTGDYSEIGSFDLDDYDFTENLTVVCNAEVPDTTVTTAAPSTTTTSTTTSTTLAPRAMAATITPRFAG